jgi:tetratricopeptide (TPR) repeat protein
MANSSEVERIVSELDAFGALRADLAARAGAAPAADGNSAGEGAPAEADRTVRAAVWLPLVVGLEGAARLQHPKLPGHFRRQRAAWDAAAEVFGDQRYSRIAARLAQWRAPAAPTLPLVTELLWALEQPEAAGFTRLALVGTTALSLLVVEDDVRAGYVLTQTARAVRTLGDSHGALTRYLIAQEIGRRYQDARLLNRTALGLGSTYQSFGNLPAARSAWKSVIESTESDARFVTAARHGLLNMAVSARDWSTALEQAWHLLRTRQGDVAARVDILVNVGDLCHRIGQYALATRAMKAALYLRPPRANQSVVAVSTLVQIAAALADRELYDEYVAKLRSYIGQNLGPWEDARALLVLAESEYVLGSPTSASRYLSRATVLANRHGYHEFQFESDRIANAFGRTVLNVSRDKSAVARQDFRLLDKRSLGIIEQLDSLDDHELLGVVEAESVRGKY